MKIVVFSDSHTDVETMAEAVRFERPDAIFHLGDHSSDAAALRNLFTGIPMYAVKGNTDFDNIYPEERDLQFEGYRILLTHGHQYGVIDYGIKELLLHGSNENFDIVLFGHTHQPFANYRSGMWFFNPGRIGKKSSKQIYATYGVLNIEEGKIGWKFVEA